MITSLIRMRLYAFGRSGRIVPPLVTTLAIVGVLCGGGQQLPGDSYGFAAYVLVPVLAWQTKLLLDTEPDVARRLAIVTVGGRRELLAGLLAATIAAAVPVVIALVMPWTLGGILLHPRPQDAPLAAGFTLGPWALIVAVPPAIALGALASRVVTRSTGFGAMALVGGWICLVVFNLPRSPFRWVAPPLLDVTKAARAAIRWDTVAGLTAWTLAWSLVAGGTYVLLRRKRA